MTNRQALIGLLMVSVPDESIEKALIDSAISERDDYVAGNAQKVAECAIEILQGLLSAPDVSEGGYSISYDRTAVEKRLTFLLDKYAPVPVSEPTVKAVRVW